MTRDEIHEENEGRIYCIICDIYIDADCYCLSCEELADKHGSIEPGFEEEKKKTCGKYTPCHHPCVACGQIDCMCCGGDGRFKRCSRKCNSFGTIVIPVKEEKS